MTHITGVQGRGEKSARSAQANATAYRKGMASSHRTKARASLPPLIWKGPLYTPAEQARRDASVWTLVQGILAPIQFIAFAVSLVLVIRFLLTGEGFLAAAVSVVAKTALLYTIMVTGSIWEKVVFGKYLFARPFFWEDVFSMLVIALHTLYLAALVAEVSGTPFVGHQGQMLIALAAYATYLVNAMQFLLKLRSARLQRAREIAGQEAAPHEATPHEATPHRAKTIANRDPEGFATQRRMKGLAQ